MSNKLKGNYDVCKSDATRVSSMPWIKCIVISRSLFYSFLNEKKSKMNECVRSVVRVSAHNAQQIIVVQKRKGVRSFLSIRNEMTSFVSPACGWFSPLLLALTLEIFVTIRFMPNFEIWFKRWIYRQYVTMMWFVATMAPLSLARPFSSSDLFDKINTYPSKSLRTATRIAIIRADSICIDSPHWNNDILFKKKNKFSSHFKCCFNFQFEFNPVILCRACMLFIFFFKFISFFFCRKKPCSRSTYFPYGCCKASFIYAKLSTSERLLLQKPR